MTDHTQIPAEMPRAVYDTLQVEAEARRLRAEFFAQGFKTLRAAISAKFAPQSLAKPQP